MSDSKDAAVGLRSRLKNLLSSNRNQNVTHGDGTASNLSDSFWNSISSNHEPSTRLTKLNIFDKLMETKVLDRGCIEQVWMNTNDLLGVELPLAIRQAYFQFIIRLIKCQFRQLGLLRIILFETLKAKHYKLKEDIVSEMQVVDALTEQGRNLHLLEQELGGHLVKWMDLLFDNKVYLSLVLNIVKFNSSHLDLDTIVKLVVSLCAHCQPMTSSAPFIPSLLKILDAIICYNCLQRSSMSTVLLTLCRTANDKMMCDQSWHIMRNLLGTHLGHDAIQIMCHMLHAGAESVQVLRSAVFYVGMGLWGSRAVAALTHKPQTVLPSFRRCAEQLDDVVVAFELVLTLQRLVNKFGHELHASAWDDVLAVVHMLFDKFGFGERTKHVAELLSNLHELLSLVENLNHTQAFHGSVERLFQIVELTVTERPVASVLLLLAHQMQLVTPTRDNWTARMLDILQTFLHPSKPLEVRRRALEAALDVTLKNFDVYEHELLDAVILPTFKDLIEVEEQVDVLEDVIGAIGRLCARCRSSRAAALFRLLDVFVAVSPTLDEQSCAVAGRFLRPCARALLVSNELFAVNLPRLRAHHLHECFRLMTCFLRTYYGSGYLLQHSELLRDERLRTLRALHDAGQAASRDLVAYSCSGVAADKHVADDNPSSSSLLPLSFGDAFACLARCVESERHWPVLDSSLGSLCALLQRHHALVRAVEPAWMKRLVDAVCVLVSNAARAGELCGGDSCSRVDVQLRAIELLHCVVPYHSTNVTIGQQRQILRVLEGGFSTKACKACIGAMTICMVEFEKEALLRLLPSVLLHLSQMSATVQLAPIVLDLLSTLSQLPHLYTNFVEEQYKSVFAIALQHVTGKFSPHVVSLAQHVVCAWFVKCRAKFRPDFVRFIARNLHLHLHGVGGGDPSQHDLIESCLDVMACYAFSDATPVMAQQRRAGSSSPATAQHSLTWLLGNRLVTVTSEHVAAPLSSSAPDGSSRKRNKSDTFAKASSMSELRTGGGARDDAVLHHSNHSSPAKSAPGSDDVAGGSGDNENGAGGAAVAHGWVEVTVRRPSGNTSWWMASRHPDHSTAHLAACDDGVVGGNHESATRRSSNSELPTSSERASDPHQPPSSSSEDDFFAVARQRSHTVSSSHDYRKSRAAARAKLGDGDKPKERSPHDGAGELVPQHLFLQMYYSAAAVDSYHRPVLVPNSPALTRATQVLDMIPPYDTWSTGVVYVRPGQGDDGAAILRNRHGSPRYQRFLRALGRMVTLADCDLSRTYVGGLDTEYGEDGLYTYVWQENVMQMVFHVATLLPNSGGSDVSNKQRHIGNDYVLVVYDDSGAAYRPGCVVRGQFLAVEIVVTPEPGGADTNRVAVEYHKADVAEQLGIGPGGGGGGWTRHVSDHNLSLLVRQSALHASIAARACRNVRVTSNAPARLKQIKSIRQRALQEASGECDSIASSSRGSTASSSQASDSESSAATAAACSYSLQEFSDYV